MHGFASTTLLHGWTTIASVFEAAELPPLPDPAGSSPLGRYIFESPLAIGGALIVLGVLWLVILLQRGKAGAKPIIAGFIAIALGGGVFLADRLVETPSERVHAATVGLIESVVDADVGAIDDAMQPGSRVEVRGFTLTKEQLIPLAEAAARGGRYNVSGGSFSIQSARIREVRVGIESDTIARAQVNVVGNANDTPYPSWWQMDFDLVEDEWKIRSMKLLWLSGFGNSD